MKVLFLSQIVPYPPHGGVLQRGYNLIRELGRAADVHLVAFVHPDEMRTREAVEESRKALGQFCTKIDYFPLWVKATPLHMLTGIATSAVSPWPFSSIAYRSAAFKECVAAALRSTPFDVLHADTIALDQYAHLDRRIPAVLTHHNIESRLMERRAHVERRPIVRQFLFNDSRKLRAQEIAAAPAYDMNITVSEQDANALRECVPGLRTAVVPNGVDVEYFSPEPAAETPAMIYTGGMNMFANRDAVMHFVSEIWPLIAERAPEARFFAVGQDPPPELLEAAKKDSRITVTGYVKDIRPFVRESAIYVVPLRVGGGTRLKVLDAMAMGKALVSTSIGCEGIAIRHGEHAILADSPAAFADAAVSLLGDSGRRRSLGRAARTLVEQRYAWPIVGRQLLGAYAEAIDGRQQQPAAAAGAAR